MRDQLNATSPASLPIRTRPSVLLAEDDDDMRRLLSLLLGNEGYSVVECRHGVDLLERLGPCVLGNESAETFDLIISDIRMPGVNGFTVLEGIAGREGLPPAS